MRAALERIDRDNSFDALSMRKLTREVGVVPTAFYRHFPDMDALGLALVDESFRTMRELLKAARAAPLPDEQLIRRSVEIFVTHVRAQRQHFQFIARERFGGVRVIRDAIHTEIRLIISELATDLGRFPVLQNWTTEDLQMIASLIVGAMVNNVEELLAADRRGREDEDIIRRAEKQLRLVILATPHWRSH